MNARAYSLTAVALACVFMLMLAACAATPVADGQSADAAAAPRDSGSSTTGARDVEPARDETPSGGGGGGGGDETKAAPLFAQFTRVDLRLTSDVEPAWALAKAGALDPVQLTLWQANGLRAGLIEAKDVAAFREALFDAVGNRVQRLHGSPGGQVPLSLTPTLARAARVKVVTDADLTERVVALEPGRTQFLLRMTPIADGQRILVELTPHHFVPHTTVEVRTPEQKMLDGKVFQSLTLSAQVRPDDLLIVGLTHITPPAPPTPPVSPTPPSPPADTTPANQVSPDAPRDDQPAEPTPPVKPDKPGLHWLPDRLGTLLLAATWRNQPVQSVLVISARELKPAPPESTRESTPAPR